MKNVIALILMKLGMIVLSTAALSQVGTVVQPLVNGSPTNERPEVGFLTTAFGSCSATLFTDRHFLTAAHCIDYRGLSLGGSLWVMTTQGPVPFNVDRVFSQGTPRHGVARDDLAVGRLTQPVTSGAVTPARISYRPPFKGELLTVIGYGCTDRNTDEGAGWKRYVEYSYSDPAANLCHGDSGGPVFLGGLKDRGPIVFVNSGRHVSSDGRDIFADPVRYYEHIHSLATAMETNGICYRVHVEDLGWMPARCNGDVAGTTHQKRRIEAIQIWSPNVEVCYVAHVQDKGWMGLVCNGEMAGTIGEGLRLEAIQIWDNSEGRRLSYQAYVQDISWQQPMRHEGQVAGTTGKGKRMEAISIQLQ